MSDSGNQRIAARAARESFHRHAPGTFYLLAAQLFTAATFSPPQSAAALTTTEIVAKAKPAVVTIELFDSINQKVCQATGWFLDKNVIVTNAHLIKGVYDTMKVYNVASGAEYTVDHYNYVNFKDDVAILTIKESSDVTLEIASQAPFEGDSVTVIANPKEHFGTVTTGIISALRRDVQGSMMQISHGSSGSPVIKNQNSSPTKVNFL